VWLEFISSSGAQLDCVGTQLIGLCGNGQDFFFHLVMELFEWPLTPKKKHSFADSENRTSSHGIVMYMWYYGEAFANPKMDII